jgi:hypothetical protein
MLKIDKNFPAPTEYGMAAVTKYPWKTMEIGDSFFVKTSSQYFPTQTRNAGRRYGRYFAVKKVSGGYRVWRVE